MAHYNTSQEDSSEKIDPLDLEDGEIEDDEEDTSALPAEVPPIEELPPPEKLQPSRIPPTPIQAPLLPQEVPALEKEKKKDPNEKSSKKRKQDEKGKKHMTEAERSILHLRKREEMQRKKWEKIRNKEAIIESIDDDFAKNIEKTLATILNKKEKEAAALVSGASGGEESYKEERDKPEEKKGKKRRKTEKDRKNKHRRVSSPKSEIDENEMINMRGGSPAMEERLDSAHSGHSEESHESEYSSDPNKIEEFEQDKKKRKKKKNNKDKNKNRGKDRKKDPPLQDSQGVCVFYLQGKCQKNDCPYSHEAVPPMKLELCKFYLMDCCAKGDKCSYMHSEFPCKFYHTGLNCTAGDDCKFAHGKPLSESLKQILFKHIETAPREILGGFPRMNREEALNMINVTQAKLHEQEQGGENKPEVKGGIPSLFDINVPVPPELLQGCDDVKNKMDKANRNRPSRWQEPETSLMERDFPLKPFNYGQDLDMRINSNGDVDMRTLPPSLSSLSSPSLPIANNILENQDLDLEKYKREAGILKLSKRDSDIRPSSILSFPTTTKDTDIRQPQLIAATKDIDIRQMPPIFSRSITSSSLDTEDEPMLQIDTGDDKKEETSSIPADLPKTQRDLFMRIQANQKDNIIESKSKEGFELDENINWYSDDDDEDDNRLTIKVDNEDTKDNKEDVAESTTEISDFLKNPPAIKPQDVVEKLGDLSKIDISAEVTKLLTSMSQGRTQIPFVKQQSTTEATPPEKVPAKVPADPRTSSSSPSSSSRQDPRLNPEKPNDSPRSDPRLSTDPRHRRRLSSTETATKPEKLSIYEQGGFKNSSPSDDDIDLRVTVFKPDIDLRNLQLPFKGMQNYTPASEIDASVNSHPPISWKLRVVEIPRPDYTGLKLSINDAEKTGDPRLRKIFRLSIEERDTPLSPRASPKAATPTVRVDPRLRKTEEPKPDPMAAAMSYNQQVTMLKSSAFYQSLSSQQKMLLNHELSQRDDANSNTHDPVLNNLLSNHDILHGQNVQANHSLTAALSILTNSSGKINQMIGQNPTMVVGPMGVPNMNQPGLLGAAPGIPNDFPMNFDPRNGGLLGNAPIPFGGFPPPQEGDGNFPPYNDDFYPQDNHQGPGPRQGGFQGGNRDNRGFNRDRRRGRNNFHNRNNGGNRQFRHNNRNNNRSNRNHSPP